MPRSRWSILVAFAGWTAFVWGTRIRNVLGDETLTDEGRTGALMLAGTMLVAALALAVVAARTWRHPPMPADARTVQVVTLATVAVWVIRAAGIVANDHGTAFVVVHLGLAVVSIGLGVAATWATRAPLARPAGAASLVGR